MTNEYYYVKDGKLVSHQAKKSSNWSFFYAIVLVFACSAGAYFYAMQKFTPPQDTIAVTQDEYKYLKKLEHEFLLSMQKVETNREYVLSRQELSEVFEHAFSEVKLSPEEKEQYLQSVATWSSKYSIPPLLVLSIIWRESSFNKETHSSANARGPMQVIYTYHKPKLDKINKSEMDLHDIDTGIRIGVEIMREYFDRYDRNIFRAMQAYVGGEHKTYARDILTRYFNARIYLEEQL